MDGVKCRFTLQKQQNLENYFKIFQENHSMIFVNSVISDLGGEGKGYYYSQISTLISTRIDKASNYWPSKLFQSIDNVYTCTEILLFFFYLGHPNLAVV